MTSPDLAAAGAGQAATDQSLSGSAGDGGIKSADAAGDGGKMNRSPRGGSTRFDRIPGKRKMREFPLTKQEIVALGAVQGGSALLLGLAGSAFGFWINVNQAIAFAGNDVSPAKLAYWEGLKDAALWGGVGLAVLALGLFAVSGFAAYRIIKETEHAR